MRSQLEELKKFTKVVADTGDIDSIAQFSPEDATTNPSLILAAAKDPKYQHIIDSTVNKVKTTYTNATPTQIIEEVVDLLSVQFGIEILKHVPGYVSTEVDARLSFSTQKTVDKAQKIIALYEKHGVDRSRILIKIASTWEGIQAAAILKQSNINCNLTLLFSFPQAVACAEAGVKLISPFVGRIRDFYRNKDVQAFDKLPPSQDPGVVSVKRIYNYYKKYNYETIVMGASFRTKEEILELCGCDRLTIAPKWLEELRNTDNAKEPVDVKLSEEMAKNSDDIEEKIEMSEEKFRWMMNEDEMGTEKLAEGIRNFAKDLGVLEKIIEKKLRA